MKHREVNKQSCDTCIIVQGGTQLYDGRLAKWSEDLENECYDLI